MSRRRGWEVLRLAAPACIVAAILLLPFLDKAYAIDDPYFLLQAQQIRRDFLHPLDYQICWFQPVVCGPASTLAPGGALMGYVLLPVVSFLRFEPVVHAIQLIFLMAAAIATVSLALRLGAAASEARIAGLLVVTFPPVLAMTNTAMPDVLALSLGAIGIDQFVGWLGRRTLLAAVAAPVALGLAPYSRLHALGLIGLAALIAAWQLLRNHQPVRSFAVSLLPLAAAITIFAAVTIATSGRSAASPLPPAYRIGTRHLDDNIIGFFWYYAACYPVTSLWLIRMRRHWPWLLACAGLVFAAYALLLKSTPKHAALCAVSGLSVVCIAWLLRTGIRGRTWEMVLGAWLLIPAVTMPYSHLPPKMLMLCAPAAAIAGASFFRAETALFRRRVFAGAIVLFAAASVLILRADENFANLGRTASAELVAPHVRKGERVWYTGQWGLYWYAMQDGARIVVPGREEPARGDLLITETVDYLGVDMDHFPTAELVESRVFEWTGGRVMSVGARAGLYSNAWGFLPWSFETGEVDRFELWRIR